VTIITPDRIPRCKSQFNLRAVTTIRKGEDGDRRLYVRPTPVKVLKD
jgi:hypothetical protein